MIEPCPWCKSVYAEPRISTTLDEGEHGEDVIQIAPRGMRFVCQKCGAMGPVVKPGSGWLDDTADARQLWNERAGAR